MSEQFTLFELPPGARHPWLGRKLKMDFVCVCGACIAVISAGKGPHAAMLRCYGCDRHVQWLSHADYQALVKTIAEIESKFGAPAEIIYRLPRQTKEENEMEYDNTDKGALFKNNDKTDDKHADYRGTINVDGVEYWLNAWVKVSKKGTKFLSLSIKPKATTARDKPKPSLADEISDEIPF
jgi:hypothetical protein